MILAIDIGNTTMNFGAFRGRRLARTLSVPTQTCRSATGLARQLRRYRATIAGVDQAILCSVVPWATPKVAKALRSMGVKRVQVVGRDVRVPLKNCYRYPKQVGQDRLVGAYAAWREFGDGALQGRRPERPPLLRFASQREAKRRGESRDCIVADFGTAITIDVVTKKGEYLGGVIAPGLDISLEALATKTALLPKVELREPPELLGRDTANSIRAGLIYGCAALCDGLVSQLKAQYAPRALVVATGGTSPLIAKYARTITHLKPHLVLEGLHAISSI